MKNSPQPLHPQKKSDFIQYDFWKHDVFGNVTIIEVQDKGVLCLNSNNEYRLACAHENGWEKMQKRFLKKI